MYPSPLPGSSPPPGTLPTGGGQKDVRESCLTEAVIPEVVRVFDGSWQVTIDRWPFPGAASKYYFFHWRTKKGFSCAFNYEGRGKHPGCPLPSGTEVPPDSGSQIVPASTYPGFKKKPPRSALKKIPNILWCLFCISLPPYHLTSISLPPPSLRPNCPLVTEPASWLGCRGVPRRDRGGDLPHRCRADEPHRREDPGHVPGSGHPAGFRPGPGPHRGGTSVGSPSSRLRAEKYIFKNAW